MTASYTHTPAYDPENIFSRILRGQIPATKILETPFALAFYDIAPQAPVHALVIPKGPYVDARAFLAQAPAEAIAGFWKAVQETLDKLSLENGYRLIANSGQDGGQEVPHFHVHILGGHPMGPMVSKKSHK